MVTPRNLFPDFSPLSCLCLDAEFASHRDVLEMLELSIVDSEGTVIYDHRFKPATIRRWNLIPHGISPEMVAAEPSFASCRPSIQRIIDGADYLMGFALENDLRRLEAQGTHRLDEKHIIELRDWFWHIYGSKHGLDYAKDIGLARCCSELGVEVDPDKAHGAAYDTLVTLQCFHILLESFNADRGPFASFGDLYSTFMEEFGEAKKAYDLEAARGYCSIFTIDNPTGILHYRFEAKRQAPDPSRADLIASIPVANRRKAIIDMSQMLTGHLLSSTSFKFPRLTAGMLDKFKSYTNRADMEEVDFARNLLKLSSAFPTSARKH